MVIKEKWGVPYEQIYSFFQEQTDVFVHKNGFRYQDCYITFNAFEEKVNQLATAGIDYCVVLEFTLELAQLTAQAFISTVLAKQLQVDTLLIGYDHRFGRNREDGFEQYKQYGAEYGMKVLKATQYSEGEASISSSEIRRLLATSHVEEAARLLTYPYRIKGHIVSGYKVGRKMSLTRLFREQVSMPYGSIGKINVIKGCCTSVIVPLWRMGITSHWKYTS